MRITNSNVEWIKLISHVPTDKSFSTKKKRSHEFRNTSFLSSYFVSILRICTIATSSRQKDPSNEFKNHSGNKFNRNNVEYRNEETTHCHYVIDTLLSQNYRRIHECLIMWRQISNVLFHFFFLYEHNCSVFKRIDQVLNARFLKTIFQWSSNSHLMKC